MTTPTEEKPQNTQNQHKPQTTPPTQDSPMADFLAFRKFATPALVQIVFWIGTLIFLIWGSNVIAAANSRWETNEVMVWSGIAILALGPVVLRIAGELILVVFRINEQIEDLRKQQP